MIITKHMCNIERLYQPSSEKILITLFGKQHSQRHTSECHQDEGKAPDDISYLWGHIRRISDTADIYGHRSRKQQRHDELQHRQDKRPMSFGCYSSQIV